MVHVAKCPYSEGRGLPTTEFHIDGKPQIYCRGWEDKRTDEPIEVCKNCKDFVYGSQIEKDYEEAKANGFKKRRVSK